jgi:hypothetical protein
VRGPDYEVRPDSRTSGLMYGLCVAALSLIVIGAACLKLVGK